MKKQNQKGFTLAELLIVVAIIAVLVAIAIPVFTKRLEQSRETTDIANLRSAYAAASVAAMSGDENGNPISNGTWKYDPDNSIGIVSGSTVSGALLGQGTSTNGDSNHDSLPAVCDYDNSKDYRKQPIEITISGGMVTAVAFTERT